MNPQKSDDWVAKEKMTSFSIGVLFIILAVFTVVGSVQSLLNHDKPNTSVGALIVSSVSMIFMLVLWYKKLILGKAIGSHAVIHDAECTLSCVKLSVVVFIGALVFILFPQVWWVDSVSSILLGVFFAKEGLEITRGEH